MRKITYLFIRAEANCCDADKALTYFVTAAGNDGILEFPLLKFLKKYKANIAQQNSRKFFSPGHQLAAKLGSKFSCTDFFICYNFITYKLELLE